MNGGHGGGNPFEDLLFGNIFGNNGRPY